MSFESALTHFQHTDPQLHAVLKRIKIDAWLDKRPGSDANGYFRALCRTIVGQQLSTKAAATIAERFTTLMGGSSYTPAIVLGCTHDQLRAVGLSNAKARYVHALAEAVEQGVVDFSNIDSLTNEEVTTMLIKVKGIGQWSAEMFLMFTLQRPDVFSYGDLGLKKGFTKIYQLEPTPENIAPIIEQWSPYTTYGCFALWHVLDEPEES